MMLAAGALLFLLGLVGVAYGLYALLRGGRDQEGGGLGPIPERAIHAVAGIRMLIGGAVAIFLGVVALPAALFGRNRGCRPGRRRGTRTGTVVLVCVLIHTLSAC